MASIKEFQNLYAQIKPKLADFGGLVSDLPMILKTAENDAPLAMQYVQNTTEKLLQDIATRESVYIEGTSCQELASALKERKAVPSLVNQHINVITNKINLTKTAKTLDQTYVAFESLVKLMQWQHGKYYQKSEDDLDMLFAGEDSPAMKYNSVKRKSTIKNKSTFSDFDLVTTDSFANADETGELKVDEISKFSADSDEFEVKFSEKPKKVHPPSKSQKPVKPADPEEKPKIKSMKTEINRQKGVQDVQRTDIPATIITKDETLRQITSDKTKTHVKQPKITPKPGGSMNQTHLPDPSLSKYVKEVYKPAKGPNPWIYVLVGFVALVFFTIGILWGKKFRDDNFENTVTTQAKFLLEEASSLRNMKATGNYSEIIAAYDKTLEKITDFREQNTGWNQAFEETSLSLRLAKEDIKREMERKSEKQATMALVKDALKSEDLLLIEETRDRVYELLMKFPEMVDSFNTEVAELEKRIRRLRKIKDLYEDMKQARRQADSLKESAELELLYRNLGILNWFNDRIQDDADLVTSVNELEQKIKNRTEYSEIEVRINYLIGIYDVASKSEDYSEVKVAREIINEFLIAYESRIDQDPEAPKYLKSSYRELATKYSLLGVHESELREAEKLLKFNLLKKQADEYVFSDDEVEIRILVSEINDFIVEYPDMRSELEKSKLALLQRLDLLRKLGDNRVKITALIAEATNLLISESPLKISDMMDKINEFIENLPESKDSFSGILTKLDERKKMLETQVTLRDRTDQLISKSQEIRSSSDMSAIVSMINEIDEFKRLSLTDEKESALLLLMLEREQKKLNERYQELRNVEIIIDSPKNGQVFATRDVTIKGRVIRSNLKQVRITLAGWSKTVELVDGAFSTDMMLVSGSNVINVTALSTTYKGEASTEVVCTVARSEFLVKLTWERADSAGGEGIAEPDLDLYVTEPTGKTVYYDDPKGDAGELLSDSRDGKKPEVYELSTLHGHKIIEGTYFIRVKYAEDRSIPRKQAEPGKKLWAGYLPKPTPVKFKLTIFRKGKFYAEHTGEITRMDYIHNGHKAWLAYPKAWWDRSCPVVVTK